MADKVIFDTNSIRNPDPNIFLWWRVELQQFSNSAEIIVPSIVIDELKQQKKRSLERKKQSFLDNPLHRLRNLNKEDTENFNIEAYIDELEANEEIEYNVIFLTEMSVLDDIKNLAVRYSPPFVTTTKDDKKNSDKWFKDAYIYFTILEYLQTIPDKKVFVCTWDWRLKEALEKHENIIVVDNYNDFSQKSVSQFCNDYFIEKLKEKIDGDLKNENIKDFRVNINNHKVILISIDEEEFVVELDSNEIIEHLNRADYKDLLEELINSDRYDTTQNVIPKINQYIHFLSDEEIKNLFDALIDNVYISWTIWYWNNSKQFYTILYESKKDLLSESDKNKISEILN